MSSQISIVVPFYNEEEAARKVLEEIVATNPGAEVLAVDDGSSDKTWEIISDVPGVTALQFAQNRGQSAAMYAGARQAGRPVIVFIDGDGQNDPADIPRLVEALGEEADVVCGYRAKRKDTASRRWASKFANAIRRMFVNDGLRDTGCSLKAFRREAVDHLVPFNGMHRFLAAQFLKGGLKIVETPVNHRGRLAGDSKYTNFNRALRGIYDLFGVKWLLNRKVSFDISVRSDPPGSSSNPEN